MSKGFILAVILCVFLCMNAGASMITFYLIETGVSEDGPDNQHSVLWENAFLDVFFDAGFIVSNAPILSPSRKPQGDILRFVDIDEALVGGTDYIIVGVLDYTGSLQAAREVDLFIYRLSPQEKILERKVERSPSRSSADEYNYMKSIARGLVTNIEQSLR